MNESIKDIMISNEFIKLQTDLSLGKDIESFMMEIRGKRDITAGDLNGGHLTEIIKRRTGMLFQFEVDKASKYNLDVAINYVKLDNVLFDFFGSKSAGKDFKRAAYGILEKYHGRLESTIDLTTCKVSGIFSQMENTLTIGINYLSKKSKFTCGEVSGAILHELGHAFCNFFYCLETVKTNVLLSVLNRAEYFESTGVKKIEILTNLENASDVTFEDKDTLVTLNDKSAYGVILKDIIERPRSEFKSKIYDLRTFEFLSDQFAVMHGRGVELASAIFKLNKINNKLGKSDVAICFKMIVLVLSSTAKAALSLLLGPKIFAIYTIYSVSVIYQQLAGATLHDSPFTRIEKIKEQLTQSLKDRNLTKKQKETILLDLSRIQKILNVTKEHPSMIKMVGEVFIPWVRKREKVAKLQHDLESIANNPLFKKSVEMELN